MLEFRAANTRSVNPRRAMLELLEEACGTTTPSVDLLLVNATTGHDLWTLSQVAREQCPGAQVLAASCAGVIGPSGPGESLHDLGMMAVRGPELRVSHVDLLVGETSFEKGVQLAQGLLGTPEPVRMVYLLASGIDIANDRLLAGIESVLGPNVPVFGATSSDQMKGEATFQSIDGITYRHAAFAVGFCDPTLTVETGATHGFVAVGEPMVVTRSEGNRIIELDGRPAWPEYLHRLGLPPNATEADTIPIGALAEALPEDAAKIYGNPHILRVVTHHTDAGEILYATTCAEGTRLWLTTRDEERIFNDLERMMAGFEAVRGDRTPVAVFHADCLARGRRLFRRVMKEELVQRLQEPFRAQWGIPPWFGMYGFGEYAQLGGRNGYHNYTTALAALYRREGGHG